MFSRSGARTDVLAQRRQDGIQLATVVLAQLLASLLQYALAGCVELFAQQLQLLLQLFLLLRLELLQLAHVHLTQLVFLVGGIHALLFHELLCALPFPLRLLSLAFGALAESVVLRYEVGPLVGHGLNSVVERADGFLSLRQVAVLVFDGAAQVFQFFAVHKPHDEKSGQEGGDGYEVECHCMRCLDCKDTVFYAKGGYDQCRIRLFSVINQ